MKNLDKILSDDSTLVENKTWSSGTGAKTKHPRLPLDLEGSGSKPDSSEMPCLSENQSKFQGYGI